MTTIKDLSAPPTAKEREKKMELVNFYIQLLKNYEWFEGAVISGSFARQTATCPIGDIDVIVIIDNKFSIWRYCYSINLPFIGI
jgi:predicted nucleotidyltransferase